MPMPTFLVLGVAKAGTTSLYQYLKQHPQIYMVPIKEPNFFAYGEAPLPAFQGPGTANMQQRVVSTLAAYQDLFKGLTGELACGEVSTTNFMPRACTRIHQYAPGAKLVLILRQPAERAYSQFLHTQRLGWEPLGDLREAVAAEATRIQQNWLPLLCYTSPGFYAAILQQYFERFPREQIRIYLYEEWQRQPTAILQDLFRFLAVDEHFIPDMTVRHNAGVAPRSGWLARFLRQSHPLKRWLSLLAPATVRQRVVRSLTHRNLTKPPPLDPQLRAQLTELYRDDILRTQALLGRDLSHWL